MESDLRQKLEMKDKKLSELEDNLTKVKLERDKLEK